MPEAIFTIGLAASGKTTWAHQQKGYIVLDSDQIRIELYNSESCQRDPHKVFDLMYKRGRAHLMEGKSVIFCSTNLSMRYRIHAIHQLSNIPNITFRAVIFNTPIDICKEQNKQRERQVPEWLFEKQVKQFQIPVAAEGWNSIQIVNRYWADVSPNSLVLDGGAQAYNSLITQDVMDFGSQQNPNHSLSLIGHCEECGKIATKANVDKNIILAAFIHDYGKAYTATRWSGEKDDGALHYPNHAEYGAYLALNMSYSLEVAQLVAYHMVPYMDEKAQTTWRARLGEELWSKIMILHEFDRMAH